METIPRVWLRTQLSQKERPIYIHLQCTGFVALTQYSLPFLSLFLFLSDTDRFEWAVELG